jgi:copper(I)-binding protein
MVKAAGIFALVLAAAVWTCAASAHEYTVGAIKIDHPWARATPKGAKVGGAYMTLTNTGKEPDRLTGGTAVIAGKLELHEMITAGGIMKMRALAKGIEIGPGQTVALKPGSYHLMLIDLKEPLVKGQKIKGTLVFEKAGSVEVEYVIEAMGADTEGHGSMHHGK